MDAQIVVVTEVVELGVRLEERVPRGAVGEREGERERVPDAEKLLLSDPVSDGEGLEDSDIETVEDRQLVPLSVCVDAKLIDTVSVGV